MRRIAAALLATFALAAPLLAAEEPAAPGPVAPVEEATTLHVHPHLAWTQVYQPQASAMPEYEVEIAADADFARVVDRDRIAAVITRYVPAKALAPGRYWWRVRGFTTGCRAEAFPGRRDTGRSRGRGGLGRPPRASYETTCKGNRTPWSEPAAFTVAPPTRTVEVPADADFRQVQATLAKAAAQSPARVVFAGDAYRLDPGKARALIDLTNVRDLVIDGGGAEVVLTAKAGFARLVGCANVHVTGFTVDYANMPHVAGTVVATDPKAQTVDLDLLPGYPRFEDDKAIAESEGGMLRTADDFAMKNGAPLVVSTAPGFERLGDRTYRLKAMRPADFRALAVGDIYVKGPRGPAGFDIEDSPDVAVTKVTMHMCTGIGFPTSGAERLRLIGVRLERKAGRPLAVQNGGQNHHNARTGPWVEGCLFEHTGDDICHVSGGVMGVREKRGPREIDLWGSPDVRVGDALQFYDREGGVLLSERRVVRADRARRTTAVTLDGDVGPIRPDAERGNPKVYRGTQVFNRNAQCNGFVFRHNVCRRGRRIGVLCKGVGGLIEHNVFEQQGGAAVDCWNAPYEGLYAEGYVIRRNRMVACGLVASRGNTSRTFRAFNRFGRAVLHRNILFAENEIRDYPCRAIVLRDSRDVVLRDNRIRNARFTTFRNEPGVVEIEGCRGVIFTGNTIDDCRPTPQGAVRIRDCTDVER